jgi:tetratricopeptide (TPR) repeat protein
VLEGRLEQAAARFEATLPTLEERGPSAELAAMLGQLGRVQALHGERERALITLDRALQLAERLGLDDVLVHALTSRAIGVIYEGRFAEARILLDGAVGLADERDQHHAWFRAAGNLAVCLQDSDRYEDCLALVDSIEARARQFGDRENLAGARGGVVTLLVVLGRWDEALARELELESMESSPWARAEFINLARARCERGEVGDAERLLQTYDYVRTAEQAELSVMFHHCQARVLRANGELDDAVAAAERGLAFRGELSSTSIQIKLALVEAIEAALAQGGDRAEELLRSVEELHPGEATPFLRAHTARFRAVLDAREGRAESVDDNFRAAAKMFDELGAAFYLAVTQLEHGEWNLARGRPEEAGRLLAEASATFERLEARPWLERMEQSGEKEVAVPA